MKENKFPAQQP